MAAGEPCVSFLMRMPQTGERHGIAVPRHRCMERPQETRAYLCEMFASTTNADASTAHLYVDGHHVDWAEPDVFARACAGAGSFWISGNKQH